MFTFSLNSQFWVAARSQKSVMEKQSYFLLEARQVTLLTQTISPGRAGHPF